MNTQQQVQIGYTAHLRGQCSNDLWVGLKARTLREALKETTELLESTRDDQYYAMCDQDRPAGYWVDIHSHTRSYPASHDELESGRSKIETIFLYTR